MAPTGDAFADLPDALVRDLLAIAMPVADQVDARVRGLADAVPSLRLAGAPFVLRKADLERPREPSVAGVDGSYQIQNLTSVDLCAAAAVAVEGTAREDRRHWQEPYHRMWAGGVPHAVDATGVLRALMVSMEVELAAEAPHDVVLLDGSFASLIIYLNQGLSSLADIPRALAAPMAAAWRDGGLLTTLTALLRSERTVAAPKYTSRDELVRALFPDGPAEAGLAALDGTDGRTIATALLHPGEYTAPLPAYRHGDGTAESYHLPASAAGKEAQREMSDALADVHAVYFKPYGWAPAVRLEVPGTATFDVRLASLLEGVERQFFTPAVVEPYPLFMADRMVKSLGAGTAVVEQAVAQQVVGLAADDRARLQLSMLCLQNHRTQGGRGGTR